MYSRIPINIVQHRPTETVHRASSAFRVRARIFRASFERDGLQIALAIAFREMRLPVRVVSITFRVNAIHLLSATCRVKIKTISSPLEHRSHHGGMFIKEKLNKRTTHLLYLTSTMLV